MTVQLPFEQAHPLEVAPLLRRLQQDGVVHAVRTAVGDQAWLVTGYEEVRRLLADERLGRSHPDPARAARLGESVLLGGADRQLRHRAGRHGPPALADAAPFLTQADARVAAPGGTADRGPARMTWPGTGRPPTCTRRWRCHCPSRSSASCSACRTPTVISSAPGAKPPAMSATRPVPSMA